MTIEVDRATELRNDLFAAAEKLGRYARILEAKVTELETVAHKGQQE
jgi:hypothetical protein